ncbi:MAG TPA: tyrosine-protein phosphatase [Vicinamibacterales bacterium]|nr:tyrosine-protein phosphatase [Vicinamibacterales bacterium]
MRLSRTSLRTCTAGLSLVLALSAAPAPAFAGGRGPLSPAAAAAGIRIDNFGQINDHYYRGAQPKGDDFRALSTLGVKLMIDLAQEGDRAEETNAAAAGMKFVRIPMSTHQVPSPAIVAQFLSLVNDPANQPVYVHCIGGKHRTGVMTALYRMSMEGWPGARAFAEMKQYKFGADFLHPEFKDFVLKYVAPAAAAAR